MLHNKSRLIFWLIALTFGLLQAYAYRQSINQDGICYLDMAEYAARGDLKQLVNGQWSPLYPAVMAAAVAIFEPTAEWKFPMIQGINFLCLIFVIFAFETFLRQLTRSAGKTFYALCWMLFLWGTFKMITVRTATPDLLMSGFVYLATAQVLRFRGGENRIGHAVLLGLVLGLGYLTKAVMFSLSGVFILVSFFVFRDRRVGFKVALPAAFMFLLVSAPYVYALSAAKGKLTFNESWKVAYSSMVNGELWGLYSAGGNSSLTAITGDIKLYSFRTNPAGTFPIAYDPSYWNKGQEVEFHIDRQLKRIFRNLIVYYNFIFNDYTVFIIGVVLFFLLIGDRKGWLNTVLREWPALVVPVVALVLYSLIYIEGRMVGVFITIILMSLFKSFGAAVFESIGKHIVYAVMIFAAMKLLLFIVGDARRGVERTEKQIGIARGLIDEGVKGGDSIGIIGADIPVDSAKYVGAVILAFSRGIESFAMEDEDTQQTVVDTFEETGCDYIVTRNLPSGRNYSGWNRLEDTGYYIIRLRDN